MSGISDSGGVQSGDSSTASAVSDRERETLDSQLSTHDDPVDALLKHGDHATQPTDVVVAPGALHRRIIKQRFAQTNIPIDSIVLLASTDIAGELQAAVDTQLAPLLDRVDRLHLLETILAERETAAARLARGLGVTSTVEIDAVERARTAIESLTGYHPARVEALREWCTHRDGPAAADCCDCLEGVLDVERTLRRRTDHATSQEMQLRRAIRLLDRQEGDCWATAYPAVERLWLCGVSAPSASLCELLGAVATLTDTQVHLGTRPVSGEGLRAHIADVCAVPEPGAEVV